jgi:rare lipoprotein A
MLEVNLTPHGAGARLRKPAFAALTIAAATGSTSAAAQAPAPPAAPPAIKASMANHVLTGSKLRVKGALFAPAGSPITVQRAKGHRWHTVAHTKTGARGRFATSFHPHSLGGLKVRVLGPNGAVRQMKATVYRKAGASWYGPGFYGHRTACGGTLSAGSLGVANKTLPCGTKVHLRYRGHNVTARVIDRGPYVGGRDYDLTPATKNRLHFGSTGTVWSSR